MDKIGIIKEIDALGRLQIPKEIRKGFGFLKQVELVTVKEGLLVKSCEFELVPRESKCDSVSDEER